MQAPTAATHPTGPFCQTAAIPTGQRALAAGVAAGCLTLLGIAAGLSPSPAGHGTHEQLGLPPCGWLMASGYPCLTCGMTTSFAAAAEGDLLGALVIQPMGALLAVGTAVAFWIALHVAVFGSRLGQVCGRMLRPRWLWIFAGAWGASWAYKIATWPGA